MPIKEIKGIIFDFGFTLYYFKDATVEKYMNCYKEGLQRCIETLQEKNILSEVSERREFEKKFNKKRMELFKLSRKTTQEYPTTEIFRNIFKNMSLKVDDTMFDILATIYHSPEENEWIPFENTKKTLQKLKQADLKLAVLSNHPHHTTIHSLINKYNLTDYFEEIITSADYGKRKPHPGIFIYTIKTMGLEEDDATKIIMCGDEYADIMGAHRAGLKKVYFKRKVEFPFEKDIPFDDYEEINEISEILKYI